MAAANVASNVDPAQPHYLEFISGPLSGNRVDVDLTEAGLLLAIDWGAPHNTLTSIPEDSSDWLGHQVVVRPHWTLDQVYAKDTFLGSNAPEEADQVLFFNGSDFDTYFLLQTEGYNQWPLGYSPGLPTKGV